MISYRSRSVIMTALTSAELHRRLEAADYYFGPPRRSPHSSGSIKSTKVRASGID